MDFDIFCKVFYTLRFWFGDYKYKTSPRNVIFFNMQNSGNGKLKIDKRKITNYKK